MTTLPPELEAYAKGARAGSNRGCVAIVAGLLALVGGIACAIARPRWGIPVLLVVLAVGYGLLRRSTRREREEAARRTSRFREAAPPVGDAWRSLFKALGLGDRVDAVAALVRPALRIETRPSRDLKVGASRLGGEPDLPESFAWPRWNGKPLSFLLQVDLAEVSEALPGSALPSSGRLVVFADTLQGAWGYRPADRGSAAVAHLPAGAALVRRVPPEDLPKEERFPSTAATFAGYEDLRELNDGHPLQAAFGEAESEAYGELEAYLETGGGPVAHKLLGHAQSIQGPMELECALVTGGIDCGSGKGYKDPRAEALAATKEEWRLLLQLDTDGAAGMMWGDAGRLYFWIRERDLKEGRFGEVWMILQCH